MSCDNCEKLQRELLSALAAIEKHNNSLDWRDICPLSVDLSLLHEHDAEVRKPLVDALVFVRDNCNRDSVIYAVARDALAKVKQ